MFVVLDDFLNDEVQEFLCEFRVKIGPFRKVGEPRDLGFFTRGVGWGQVVLGVTFPDHVSAKPNPGISKITQERIEPQAQESAPIDGEDRGRRDAPMGRMSRRGLPPWMQDLVRNFFSSLREEGQPQ